MARPSKAQEKFVDLYVNGPDHIRGQWAACANAAGMREPPDEEDVMLQRKIAALREVSPEPPANVLEAVFADIDAGVPWKELRSKLTNVIRSVADGTVVARASQVSMLQFIIKKAEEEAALEDEVHNVILLPVQGADSAMVIDAEWIRKIKALETSSEE